MALVALVALAECLLLRVLVDSLLLRVLVDSLPDSLECLPRRFLQRWSRRRPSYRPTRG